MSEKEIELFLETVTPYKYYFEFGSGGSTRLVYNKTKCHITTIDSSLEWIQKIKELVPPGDRITYKHVDIGEIGEWGRPVNDEKKHQWHKYYEAIDEHPETEIVLADGRFRVSCVLRTAMVCPDAKILIHDFFFRPQYHVVLEVLDCMESVDQLGVFKVKENADRNVIVALLEQHKYKTD